MKTRGFHLAPVVQEQALFPADPPPRRCLELSREIIMLRPLQLLTRKAGLAHGWHGNVIPPLPYTWASIQ